MEPLTVLVEKSIKRNVPKTRKTVLVMMAEEASYQLIKGLRGGWSKRLRFLYLNYHGQWHFLDKAKVFDRNWLTPKKVWHVSGLKA